MRTPLEEEIDNILYQYKDYKVKRVAGVLRFAVMQAFFKTLKKETSLIQRIIDENKAV